MQKDKPFTDEENSSVLANVELWTVYKTKLATKGIIHVSPQIANISIKAYNIGFSNCLCHLHDQL